MALACGIARRGFDYDEVEHAHASWLIASGDRPYDDFFECHPPFVWYGLAPVARLIPEPIALLLTLRTVAALGNLAVIALILACMRAGRREVPAAWSFISIMVAAAAPRNLEYLLELRTDSWPTAGLLAAVLLLQFERPARPVLRYALFAVVATLCTLASPKLAAWTALLSLVSLFWEFRRGVTSVGVALIGLVAGVGVGFGAAMSFFAWTGIDSARAYHLSVTYHRLILQGAHFSTTLAGALMAQPFLLALCAGGALCWIAGWRSKAYTPTRFEISVFLYLVVQCAFVRFSYKQYYAPWFLLAAIFIPFLLMFSGRVWRSLPAVLAWILLLYAGSVATVTGLRFRQARGVEQQRAYFQLIGRITPPDARVLAAVPLHPVTMRDACYGWVRSIDPGGTYETEAVVRDLDVPEVAARFSADHYRRELEEHRPALIAVGDRPDLRLAPIQAKVVAAYLQQRRDEYRVIRIGPVTLWVRRANASEASM